MRDISTGKSVKQLAEMFQTHILEKKMKEENRDKARSKMEGKNRSREEAETEDTLDTTVLSIKESFTEPIIIEPAALGEQSKEKTFLGESSKVETNVEVHKRDDSRASGKIKERKKKAKSVRSSANSDDGVLFEDEEKVCLATSASGGSKRKTFSRPEVGRAYSRSPAIGNKKIFTDQENIFLSETRT